MGRLILHMYWHTAHSSVVSTPSMFHLVATHSDRSHDVFPKERSARALRNRGPGLGLLLRTIFRALVATCNKIRPPPWNTCLIPFQVELMSLFRAPDRHDPPPKNSIHLQDAVGKSLATANVQDSQSASLVLLSGKK